MSEKQSAHWSGNILNKELETLAKLSIIDVHAPNDASAEWLCAEEVARRGVSVHVVSADESVEHVKLELKKATTYLSTMELRRAARGTAEEETSMHI